MAFPIELLSNTYGRFTQVFLSERNLIVHSFMAAAVFWKIDVSGLKFFIYFICLQLCNTTCNWCPNHSLYIWQNLILACWAVSKRSLEFVSKDVKWGVIQPLETCYALLFLFHDHSELTTVVYFSLGTDNFFISLGSHMGYRCCCIHANFCKQFPVNFSIFSRDLKHG